MAQLNAIGGVIIDADNGVPVSFASVFISNSSMGVTCDGSGQFILKDIPVSGGHELVVSSAGYETFTYVFSSNQLPLNLRISLNRKIVNIQDVTILPVEKDGWQKWGKYFIMYFIGQSANAKNCEILNPEVIQFRHNKSQKSIEATANEVILVRNNRLGYVIKYQLEHFNFQYEKSNVVYVGYPLFTEIETNDSARQKKYATRRLKSYQGSVMHFVRSLYRNTLVSEGFEVKRLKRRMVLDTVWLDGYVNVFNEFDSAIHRQDGRSYFLRWLQKESLDSSVLTADSLLTANLDSSSLHFHFKNLLYIRYLKEPESAEFGKANFRQKQLPFQWSKLSLLNDAEAISIHSNGYYNPVLDLQLEGYMGWEKMAELLPFNYEPPLESIAE
jgi:hypothetical protein